MLKYINEFFLQHSNKTVRVNSFSDSLVSRLTFIQCLFFFRDSSMFTVFRLNLLCFFAHNLP